MTTGHGVAREPAGTPYTPGAAAPVVELRGVTKSFATGDGTITALDGIDLSIRPGELVSLIGPSGCGKSTLLRLIGDLTPPTGGSVTVNGRDIAVDHPGAYALIEHERHTEGVLHLEVRAGVTCHAVCFTPGLTGEAGA